MWRSGRAKKDHIRGVKEVIKLFVIKLYGFCSLCWPRRCPVSSTEDENSNLLSEVSLQREESRVPLSIVLTQVWEQKSCSAGPKTQPHPTLLSGCNCLRLLLREAEMLFEMSQAAGVKATECLHEKPTYHFKWIVKKAQVCIPVWSLAAPSSS